MGIFTGRERNIIRAHRLDTLCYLVADAGECIELAKGRVRAVTGRKLVHKKTRDLPKVLPASWMVAVIHCPDHDVDALATWASGLVLADLERIIFYEPESYPAADAARALRPWMTAGLGAPVRQRVADFRELNQVLGNDLNWRILFDHASKRS